MQTDVDPGTFVQVLTYLVNHRPTILHTHLVHADAYGQTAGTLAGIPIRFSTKHGFNEFREGRIFALGDRTIGALANRQIAISRGLARYLSETEGFPEPDFEIVHYGIAAGPEPEPYAGEAPRFLCIGRLIPIKGHVVLLRAFRKRARRTARCELDIAGRGVLEHGLKDLSRELGLNGSVRFLGHVTPVQRGVEQSIAVVVPSLGEGFGMVALEAMERARPVIAASIGGLEDLVRDGETGLLVQPGDADSLAGGDARARRRPGARGRDGHRGAPPRDRALPGGSLHRADRGGLPLLARPPPEGRFAAASGGGEHRRAGVDVASLPELEHAEAPQPVAVVGAAARVCSRSSRSSSARRKSPRSAPPRSSSSRRSARSSSAEPPVERDAEARLRRGRRSRAAGRPRTPA